jgi:chaperone BCS1
MDDPVGLFKSLLPADNAVFSGGLGLAALAAGAQMLRGCSQVGITMARRHFLVTLEVTSKDRSYPWVLQWLATRQFRNQHLSVETSLRARTDGTVSVFDFVPGPGNHFINYKGRFLHIQRIREATMLDLNSGKPWEKIQFIGIGRNTDVFTDLIHEAFELATAQEEGKTIIYTNWGTEWRPFGQPRRRRPLESVILDSGVTDRLLKDVNKWSDSSQWYIDRGIPYRRGYLLHGPPGSGKTSFITALAGRLGYNICILNLAERGLTDDRLALAMTVVPPQSIVLLEDIDAAFPRRDGADRRSMQHTSSDITFSGLLNTLDGVASSEERLIFMTTNHLDQLDPALIRPGRVDVIQHIGDATAHQIEAMAKRFYPECTNEMAREMSSQLSEFGISVSMAKLQGFFVQYPESFECALNNLRSLECDSSEILLRPPVEAKDQRETDSDSDKSKRRGGRRISATEIDRMVFNPQDGWDQDLTDISKK